MLFAPSITGDLNPHQPSAEGPPLINAVLLLSLGEVDFDCPHVDARADEEPLHYDVEPLSVWALSDTSREQLELVELRDLAGSPLDPWPVLDREAHLSNMLKRDDTSLNVLDLYELTLGGTVQRAAGSLCAVEELRVCCTRDLLALDARLSDGRPLRPRRADLRVCPEALAPKLGADDALLPVFDRTGSTALISPHEALRRRHAVDAQMRAILRTIRAPHEAFVDRRLCA